MRAYLLPAVAVIMASAAVGQTKDSAGSGPVVTEPACTQWPLRTKNGPAGANPTIKILYDPASPDARLAASQALTLVVASAVSEYNFFSSMIPMERTADGRWQTQYKPTGPYSFGYSIFLFRDEKGRVDNNHGLYWDLSDCRDSWTGEIVVLAKALTYEGRLLAPGFQRTRDLDQAIRILKDDLATIPTPFSHYHHIWRLEVDSGHNTPAAYAQFGRELDAFREKYGSDLHAMLSVAGYVAIDQRKLPPDVVACFRAALAALPETTEPVQFNAETKQSIPVPRDEKFKQRVRSQTAYDLLDFDFWSLDFDEKDLRKKADTFRAFAADHPNSYQAQSAYKIVFECSKQAHDIRGAEAATRPMAAFDPNSPFPLVDLAEFLVAEKKQPHRALQLLDQAEKLYLKGEAPGSKAHYGGPPGQVETLRGQAHLLLNDLKAARADYAAAARAVPNDPDIPLQLGRICDRLGDRPCALAAYLTAATSPAQASREPGESYARVFVALGLGSKEDADQKLAAKAAENARKVAAEYTPIAMARPAPDFAFTDLAGAQLTNRTAMGKPTLLAFWATWCPPCVAELPEIEAFQVQHPEVNLLAVGVGITPEEIKTFLAAHDLKVLRTASIEDLPAGFGCGLPTSVLIDRSGQIQYVHSGKLPDFGAFLAKDLQSLLEPE